MPAKLKYYRAAADNNQDEIKRVLLKHPEMLNTRNSVDDSQSLYHTIVGIIKVWGWGFGSLMGIALAPPAAIVIAAGGLYKMEQTSHHKARILSRIGWTLLDYAAEYGASNVAVQLIMAGANTQNGYFRQVANFFGHTKFITACDQAIATKQEWDGKLLQAQNDTALLTEKNNQLTLKVISYKNKFLELKDQYLRLHNTTLALLDQQSESTTQSLFESLQAQRDKIVALHNTLSFVNNMQHSSNPALNARAEKLYKTLSAYYVQIVADYTQTKEQYEQLSNNFAPPLKICSLQTHSLFAQKNNEHTNPKYDFGLRDRKVPFKAGNCFFDAVIAQSPEQEEWTVERLRQQIKDELLANHDVYSPTFIGKPNKQQTMEIGGTIYPYQGYDEYCSLIAIDRCYVEHIHIQAFCETQATCCVIVHAGSKQITVVGERHILSNNPPIFVGYENNDHYVALSLPDDRSWKAQLESMITQEDVTLMLSDSTPETLRIMLSSIPESAPRLAC